jgi:hypothetical protein
MAFIQCLDYFVYLDKFYGMKGKKTQKKNYQVGTKSKKYKKKKK